MSTEDNDGRVTAGQSDEPATAARPSDERTIEDLEDRWRRTAAELDNTRKRCARQVAEERAAERTRVAVQWLPVVDNLERALDHAPAGDPVVDGVRAVRDQAVEILARLGFPRHAETAVPFDPYRHEAVGVVAQPGAPSGQVVRVLRPGYGDGDRQLRPAAVLVAGGEGGGEGGTAVDEQE